MHHLHPAFRTAFARLWLPAIEKNMAHWWLPTVPWRSWLRPGLCHGVHTWVDHFWGQIPGPRSQNFHLSPGNKGFIRFQMPTSKDKTAPSPEPRAPQLQCPFCPGICTSSTHGAAPWRQPLLRLASCQLCGEHNTVKCVPPNHRTISKNQMLILTSCVMQQTEAWLPVSVLSWKIYVASPTLSPEDPQLRTLLLDQPGHCFRFSQRAPTLILEVVRWSTIIWKICAIPQHGQL